MSTLVVEELRPGTVFVQNFTIDRTVSIAHIRPWVLVNGVLLDGDFVCRVKEGSTVLREVSLNYVDINAAMTDTYAHGFMRFDINPLVLHVPDGQATAAYIIEFEMINHTFAANNFIGINRSWENKIYPVNYTPPNDIAEPSGVEIYEWRQL